MQRIIDANFNRAREALRVVEEYCRFALDSKRLGSRAKELRHQLCSIIGELDGGALVACRDSDGDVGVGVEVEDQLRRSGLEDCFTAGCKRLSEALRVLGEMISIESRERGGRIERIRFAAYSLEKDIVMHSEPAGKYARVRLYVVITSDFPVEVLSLAAKCAAGGADCIQMRAKAVDDEKLFAMAVEFVKVCHEGGALSIINDRADIAIASGADGVHVGQEDLPVEQVRRLANRPLIIGKSTHAREQLEAAIEDGVTYAALGPVFATGTKPKVPAVTLDYVRQGAKMLEGTGIGNVAIGGITVENVGEVIAAGARSIAVCAAATQVADPAGACRALRGRIVEVLGEAGE